MFDLLIVPRAHQFGLVYIIYAFDMEIIRYCKCDYAMPSTSKMIEIFEIFSMENIVKVLNLLLG